MILKTFAATLLIAALAPLASQAEIIRGAAVINVPYRFAIGDTMLDPGEYYVRQITVQGYDTKQLHFYKDGGQQWVASIFTAPAYRNTPAETNIVETLKAENGSYHLLDKIWIVGDYTGFTILNTRNTGS